jgi:hypothetical protein
MNKVSAILHPNDAKAPILRELPPDTIPNLDEAVSSSKFVAPDANWNYTTCGALFMLVLLWAVKLFTTWGAWGNLTIDSGHEMYVPLMLAQGKVLYRDVWFMYGPAAPYFNSILFRLFGSQLNVLYWAGSLSALGAAILLYLTGIQLSSWLAGWTAGAVLLMEAFQPSLFCFPLGYSFATVYACLVGCLFLWLAIHASTSMNLRWMLGSGIAAAVAVLLKLEFGAACYATLVPLIALRAIDQRSWKSVAKDVLAVLPGVAACALVIMWMVSIRGVEFITQENIMSWPTAYFMKTYGKMWLAGTGFSLTGAAFLGSMFRAMPVAAVVLVAWCLLWWKRSDRTANIIRMATVLALVLYIFGTDISRRPFSHTTHTPSTNEALFLVIPMIALALVIFSVVYWKRWDRPAILMRLMMVLAFILYVVKSDDFLSALRFPLKVLLSAIFFPQDMVLYVMLACCIAWLGLWSRRNGNVCRKAAIPLLLTFSSLLAFRLLMKMAAGGYPIYYNGPVVLSFLLVAFWIIPRSGRSRWFIFVGELAICLGCLISVGLHTTQTESEAKDFVPLTVARGTIRVSKHMAKNYTAALQFMKDKASQGESILSVPEDTSLYFLSETICQRAFTCLPRGRWFLET